jgi:hypothetical protein
MKNHVNPGQGCGHTDVAFIGQSGDMPGLGTGKVASRDPHVRLKKLLAQRLPCRQRQRGWIIRIRDAQFICKKAADRFTALMDGRRDNV